MKRIALLSSLCAALLLSIDAGAIGAQQTFRSSTSAIVIPVSVTDKSRPVMSLKASDFELQDNGVLQNVAASTVESLPVDVTLLVDTSGSLEGAALNQFRKDVQDIVDGLRPADRIRLVTFATNPADAFGLHAGGVRVPTERITAGGGTSFYDALSATLMALPKSDRLQMIFGFTDGDDTMSFLGADDVKNAARASGAALFLTIVNQEIRPARMMTLWRGGVDMGALKDAAATTGGAVYAVNAGTPLPTLFRRVLEDFRTSYVLTFTPQGVKAEGWHDITVRVKSGRYTVRARKGYVG